eukprot:TRINITY_DN31746_c0_g1_i1.p1 TRINITY_DN31746_c0_g1~~TRINITY_DN31746_c0_g1_i1.p1  ORF type:complete len:300 (+),score=14.17 TRINITY_DN31746_c0_g1_i1:209-1108(+)
MDATKCNVFQYCKFLLYCGYSMTLIVFFMVGVSYYPVVILNYGPMTFNSGILGIFYAILTLTFSACIFMLLWSYLACVIASPGHVPHNWHPFGSDEEAAQMVEQQAYLLQIFDQEDPIRPRYCMKCANWKPPRAHHDSVSRKCVLKMDHFCIWVINCVGLLNYKFFLLFLFYSWISCFYASILLIYPLINFFENMKNPVELFTLFGFVLDLAFTISLAGFIFMHYQLLSGNKTTIEVMKKGVNPWPFDKGRRKNFEEVFGRETWRWFLPYYSDDEVKNLLANALSQKLRVGQLSSDVNV